MKETNKDLRRKTPIMKITHNMEPNLPISISVVAGLGRTTMVIEACRTWKILTILITKIVRVSRYTHKNMLWHTNYLNKYPITVEPCSTLRMVASALHYAWRPLPYITHGGLCPTLRIVASAPYYAWWPLPHITHSGLCLPYITHGGLCPTLRMVAYIADGGPCCVFPPLCIFRIIIFRSYLLWCVRGISETRLPITLFFKI